MKKICFSLFALVAVLLLDSCTASKNVAYFQNIENVDLSASKGLFEAHIMPKDELSIAVNSSDPAASSMFNLVVNQTTSSSEKFTLSSQVVVVNYLVDNEGDIIFPKLGKIHVQGMTRSELQDYLVQRIKPFFAEDETPIVTVKMSNYRVTVMGEVNAPRVVTVSAEKMSVLEALTQAGDLSIYGQRKDVLIIREDAAGQKSYHRLDLTDANIINDPYFYLQQNDIIYVTPNPTKAKNAEIGQSTTLWFSFSSILLSVATLLINVLK